MKERPILFSAPMVRAILEGRKTQTRRVVTHKGQQPPVWATWVNHLKHLTMRHEWVDSNIFQWSEEQTPGQPLKTLRRWPVGEVKVGRKYSTEMDYAIPCPYGVPGDRLWVRETWAYCGGIEYMYQKLSEQVAYRATWDKDRYTWGLPPVEVAGVDYIPGYKWHPSIHMPRWASRITLEVTGVRVERVQEITLEDVLAEGIPEQHDHAQHADEYWRENTLAKFIQLWDSINSARGFGWDANPWVWCISFKRVEATHG